MLFRPPDVRKENDMEDATDQTTMNLLCQHPKFTKELARQMRLKGGADRALDALRREFFPMENCVVAKNEYDVPVGYDMPKDKASLEAVFSKDQVSEMFYGDRAWEYHPSCIGIDRTPGRRIMLVKVIGGRIDGDADRERAIAKMDKRGYRPAIHHEAYAFTKAHPEAQRKQCVFVLGSFSLRFRWGYIMRLTTNCGKLALLSYGLDQSMGPNARVLWVRKSD